MLSMNPNKALWEKGDFTRIAETMRESGEALVQRLGITKGTQGSGSRMRRWHHRIARGETRSRRAGRRYRAQPGRGWEQTGRGAGPDQLQFQEGDASNLEQLPDKALIS